MKQEEIMQQLQKAVALHNRGELDRAEAIYTEVLSVDENNFYALRFLGCICRAKGMFQDGMILECQPYPDSEKEAIQQVP